MACLMVARHAEHPLGHRAPNREAGSGSLRVLNSVGSCPKPKTQNPKPKTRNPNQKIRQAPGLPAEPAERFAERGLEEPALVGLAITVGLRK